MGLFWSMATTPGHENGSFTAPGEDAFKVTLTATAAGKSVSTTIIRRVNGENVTQTELSLDTTGIYGTYFNPAAPAEKSRPAVLVFGGSEGGVRFGRLAARGLAARGFPALGIAYFAQSGLPSTLDGIPLEYFAKALTWLRGQPGIDPHRVWVMGVSRGSEAALLTAAHFPALANGVVAGSPSAVAIQALGGSAPVARSAWTLDGEPLPYQPTFGTGAAEDPRAIIPVELIQGPVLTVAGQNDHLWPSAVWASEIMARLDLHHVAFPHQNLSYPGAGHNVGGFIPYLPLTSKVQTPYGTLDLGGDPGTDTRAMADAWPRVLAFLTS
jgi:dienelactone hydrolase